MRVIQTLWTAKKNLLEDGFGWIDPETALGGSHQNGYHYFDPATKDPQRGTSKANTFYFSNNKLTDINTCRGGGTKVEYVVTSIRQNQ